MKTLLVNVAAWDPPKPVPDGWLIANAPRPLAAAREWTWTGEFRHGIHYAASPQIPEGTFGWEADDAYLVEFITDAEIERRCLAKAATFGYGDRAALEADGLTVADFAESLSLPWRGGAA